MNNHVILITGLGSSLPSFLGAYWRAWAVKMEKRLRDHYNGRKDVIITRVSSDFKGYVPALSAMQRDKKNKSLGTVCIVGHSNGFRDALKVAEAIRESPVAYVAGIDMTLGEFGAEVYSNTKLFHEFKAKRGLKETADFHHLFDKSNYQSWTINNRHTAAASNDFVQNKIFYTITETIK